jgi:MFS family permease
MPDASQRAAAMRFIICLGLVSLFADVTYEGARSITGPFLRDLGATAALVGFVAGLGEFLGFTLRLASGLLADRTRAYWTITILGYAVNLFAIPLLAFTRHWPAAALLIIAERAGKSLRAPARDVLLSEAAHKVGTGRGFGLHAAMDQTGAVIGPLFVAWEVARTHRFSNAFLYLAIPAACALAALLMARGNAIPVEEPRPAPQTQSLPRLFWVYVGAAGLLAMGYVDFPLIAYHLGKSEVATRAGIPLLYAVAMAANGVTAPVFGRLYDRFGLGVLPAGIVISAAALPLSFFGGIDDAILGLACWGTGMGAMDAVLRSGISHIVTMNKRGRAFGLFNAVFGAMWLVGSSAMGLLYDHSILGLVVLGVAAQLAAAVVFFSLRKQFR